MVVTTPTPASSKGDVVCPTRAITNDKIKNISSPCTRVPFSSHFVWAVRTLATISFIATKATTEGTIKAIGQILNLLIATDQVGTIDIGDMNWLSPVNAVRVDLVDFSLTITWTVTFLLPLEVVEQRLAEGTRTMIYSYQGLVDFSLYFKGRLITCKEKGGFLLLP